MSLRKECNYCGENSQYLAFLWRNAPQNLNGKRNEVDWQILCKTTGDLWE